MDTIVRGNAIYLTVSLKDGTDIDYPLVTPNGGVTCTIVQPDGDTIVNAEVMTEEEIGIYSLTQQTDEDWQLGTYKVKVVSTHGGFTNMDMQYFQLVSES